MAIQGALLTTDRFGLALYDQPDGWSCALLGGRRRLWQMPSDSTERRGALLRAQGEQKLAPTTNRRSEMKITIPELTITIPGPATLRRFWKWGLLAVLALTVTLTWGSVTLDTTEAETQPGAVMSLIVKNGDPDCDSNTQVNNCQIDKGSTFTLSIEVKKHPGPYIGFTTNVQYSGQSTYLKAASELDEIKWPQCNLPARSQDPGSVIHVCSTSMTPPFPTSEFKGNIVNLEFYCDPALSGKGEIDLIPQDGDPLGAAFWMEDLTSVPAAPAHLSIDCVPMQEINITTQSVQVPLPGACYNVYSWATGTSFNVCDNDSQTVNTHAACLKDGTPECTDDDPADGSIRVAVDPGNYDVTQKKAPFNHDPNLSLLYCDPVLAIKCDVTFKNTALTNPWFPWDINGDKYVDLPNDILGVIMHYQDSK